MDRPIKKDYSYPTTVTMPSETYNKQLADVSSSQYKTLLNKLEIMVIVHSPRRRFLFSIARTVGVTHANEIPPNVIVFW